MGRPTMEQRYAYLDVARQCYVAVIDSGSHQRRALVGLSVPAGQALWAFPSRGGWEYCVMPGRRRRGAVRLQEGPLKVELGDVLGWLVDLDRLAHEGL